MSLTTFADGEALSSVRTKLNNLTQQRALLRLTSSAATGQADVVVDSQVPADVLVAIGYGQTNEEIHRISSSASQTLTLDSNLRHTHAADDPVATFAGEPVVARGLIARTSPTTQTTDSSTALQAFLDDLETEDEGAVVLIPPGIYDIETSIVVPQGCKIIGGHFVGQGLATGSEEIFGTAENDVAFFNMTFHGDYHDGISLGPCKRFGIYNCTFFGGDGSGVRLSNVQKGIIHGCRFEKGTNSPYESNALVFDEGVLNAGGTGQTCEDVVVSDCYIEGPDKAGVIFNDGKQCRISNCVFIDIAGDGNTTGDAMSFYQTSTGTEATNTGCVAEGNLVDGANRMGVYVQGAPECVITDNVFKDCCKTLVESSTLMGAAIGVAPDQSAYPGSGYYIGAEQNTLVQNNYIDNCSGGPGIAFAGNKVHIVDNVIDSPKHYGISCRGADHCVIKGNVFIDCDTDFHRWEPGVLRDNTCQGGGSSTTVVLDASASGSDDAYNGTYILTDGTNGPGQRRFITDYVGSTKTATVSEAWNVVPNASTNYVIETNRFHNNYVEHGLSNRGIEPRVLAGLTVHEGENEYFWERGFTAITDLVGGYLGQTIRIYESYSGITYTNNSNAADVDSPITFINNANRSSVDAGTASGGVLTLRKGGLKYRPSKVIHSDNGVNTALANVIDDSTGTQDTITLVAAEDYLMVCFARTFNSVYITMGGTKNAVASTISAVELSDGQSGWNATTLLRDHSQSRDITTGPNGKTFSTDGWIQWMVPEDGSWDDDTYDTTTGRWMRLTFSADWTASTQIEEIDVKSWGWVEVTND